MQKADVVIIQLDSFAKSLPANNTISCCQYKVAMYTHDCISVNMAACWVKHSALNVASCMVCNFYSRQGLADNFLAHIFACLDWLQDRVEPL